MVKISGVDLVKYLLSKYGPLPQKKLQKLAYFAEYGYIKKYGERLSDLSFKRYYYGPYSEGIEENVIIKEQDNGYPTKLSELVNEKVDIDNKLAAEIDSLLLPYINRNGSELEKLADETQPYIDAEEFNNPIKMDDFAWYYRLINSREFWEEAEKIHNENIKKGAYHKHIIKSDAELDELFS